MHLSIFLNHLSNFNKQNDKVVFNDSYLKNNIYKPFIRRQNGNNGRGGELCKLNVPTFFRYCKALNWILATTTLKWGQEVKVNFNHRNNCNSREVNRVKGQV